MFNGAAGSGPPLVPAVVPLGPDDGAGGKLEPARAGGEIVAAARTRDIATTSGPGVMGARHRTDCRCAGNYCAGNYRTDGHPVLTCITFRVQLRSPARTIFINKNLDD
jgi:hypothetical protein